MSEIRDLRDSQDRLDRRTRDLEERVRSVEQSVDTLRSEVGRDTVELRQSLVGVSKDLEALNTTLRSLSSSMDEFWRQNWPTLESRLTRIETTVEGVSQRVVAPPPSSHSVPLTDWRVIGLIAAALFGGGLTVGGGAGAGLVPLMTAQPARQAAESPVE